MIKYVLSNLIPIGTLYKSQGVKGFIIAQIDEKLENHISAINYIFINQGGQSLPFFIEHTSIEGNNVIFKFENINTPESASLLSNKTIYLDKEKIQEFGIQLNGNTSIFLDLELYNNSEFVGTISEILELPGHSLLKIKENDLISIPLVEDWIISVDNEKMVMSFNEDILSINQ